MEKGLTSESIPENILASVEASQELESERWVRLFFYEEDHKSNVDNFQKYLEGNFPGITFEKKLKPWVDWNSEWEEII